MLVIARRFLYILVLLAFIHIFIHIFLSPFKETSKFRRTQRKSPSNSIESTNLIVNEKLLRGVIMKIENTTDSFIQIQSKDNRKITKKDLFHYYFDLSVQKRRPLCPLIPPNLGPVGEDKDIMNLYGLDDMVLHVQAGGIFRPVECLPRQLVAIIAVLHETHIEVRNFIGSFLYYIHPFLMKQQISYQIFIVVRANAVPPFKRGELFNIGFEAAQNYTNKTWDCVIFHDIYIVPVDTRNLYRCSRRPKKIIDFGKQSMFGGVIAMKPTQFILVNGFSNLVWSRNDDYEDMYKRLIAANLTTEENKSPIANYTVIEYLKQLNNGSLQSPTVSPYYLKDGLSNLPFHISKTIIRDYYTLVELNIEAKPSQLPKI